MLEVSRVAQSQFLNPEALALALFLLLIVNRLVEYVKQFLDEPVGDAMEKTRKRVLLGLSFAFGVVIALVTTVDLFASGVFASPLISKIATAVVIGGGSNILNDLVNHNPAAG